jgi:Mrp family chromosome partitioning ATPase
VIRRILPPLVLLLVAALVGAAVGYAVSEDAWAAAGGAAAGLVLAAPVAALLARRRPRRLADGADAAAVAGLPLIAHVPAPGSDETDRRRAQEAFRMLRAAVLPRPGADGAEARTRAILVTSAAPGEGKTTVAAGLARALARAGRPVVVVEADLRRPGLAAALGRGDATGTGTVSGGAALRGLSAAIVGGVPVVDLLVEVEPGLRLLAAGELPPNAPELLGSPDAGRVLDELLALGVDVVLDTAPLLPVADTRELLTRADGARVVLVARPGVAGRDELRDAVALLPADADALLVVSGRARAPRSYDRYLADGERP